eukprot:COSAG04_NODE_1893_length_5290_cov_1.894433_4_plen_518_part_00
MCAGNADPIDDFNCTSPSVPDPRAAEITRTSDEDDQERCCTIVGMCSNNDPPQADVDCDFPSQLVLHARSVFARDSEACCHVTGMCKGNSNVDAEPDIECIQEESLQPRPSAESIIGRDKDSCCLKLFCAGNANETLYPNFPCEPPLRRVSDALTKMGYDESTCCKAAGLCVGNDNPSEDVTRADCGGWSLKEDASAIYRSDDSVEECCECDPDRVDAYCVAMLEESSALDGDTRYAAQLSDNQCTNVMAYAGCDGDYERCRTDSNAVLDGDAECEDCKDPEYKAFQHLADENAAQGLCVGGFDVGTKHYNCTYIFRRGRCITGMCSGNSDQDFDPDITCPADMQPVENPHQVVGRSVERCCTRRGYCCSNSEREHQPNITCVTPMQPKESCDAIFGRTREICCEATGMCTGNSDQALDPDVVCDEYSELVLDSDHIAGRTQEECCERRGYCSNNTNSDHEPDVACPHENLELLPDRTLKGRSQEACCGRTGMCTSPSSIHLFTHLFVRLSLLPLSR